jgi:hypothetical protein
VSVGSGSEAGGGRRTAGKLGLGAWAGRPRLLPAKLHRVWRRWRSQPLYRTRLAAGCYMVEAGSPSAAPTVSVAMPVHRVGEGHLRAAIASVRQQSARGWELLLLDDASPEPHVRRVLAEAARDDPRVRVLLRDENAGIARASDQLIAEARGDFVAFLDHDDMLHPRAIELVGTALATQPEVDWLFTDEDKVDEHGRHREPCFKPGWSPHLLLAFNLTAHFRVVRRSLLTALGGHRDGFEGAQDYDLALRALGAGATFAHLPGVLYHWRATQESMARGAAAKPEANRRALRALTEHVGAFPLGGEVVAHTLMAPASVFRVRRRATATLRLAAVVPDTAVGARLRIGERDIAVLTLDPAGGEDAVLEAARRSDADVILARVARLSEAALEEILSLLLVTGTGAVGARLVRGRRVAASGWQADQAGALYDPWAGMLRHDPGYLNLALIPAPRLALPPTAWAAWRETIIEAYDAAPPGLGPWRFAAGLIARRRHVVVSPDAEAQSNESPPAPACHPLAARATPSRGWLEELGLESRQARIPAEE